MGTSQIPSELEILCAKHTMDTATLRKGDLVFVGMAGGLVRVKLKRVKAREGLVRFVHEGEMYEAASDAVLHAGVLERTRYNLGMALASSAAALARADGMAIPEKLSVRDTRTAAKVEGLRLTALAAGLTIGAGFDLLDVTDEGVGVLVSVGHESRVYRVPIPDLATMKDHGVTTWRSPEEPGEDNA